MKERIPYYDAIRGFAIILVVYCHVASVSLGISEAIPSFNNIVGFIHLPIFFFLSGYLLFRPGRFDRWTENGTFLKNKFLQLVIPATIFLVLYALIFQRSFSSVLFSRFKGGYWFTYFLFVFNLLYLFLSWLLDKIGAERKAPLIIFLLSIIVSAAPVALDIVYPQAPDDKFLQAISYQEYHFFQFFCFGAYLKSVNQCFENMTKNKWMKALIVLAPFILIILHSFRIPGIDYPVTVLLSYSAVIMVFLLFKEWKGLATTRIGKVLCLIGRRSLDVYFIHFFLLPDLHGVGQYFYDNPNPVLEFLLSMCIAMAIVSVCLIIGHLLRKSDFIAKLLFGRVDR